MSQPANPTLIENLHNFFTLQSLSIGFLALLWYDYLLTFAQEVQLVWPAASSTTKYAMLSYRYGTLLSLTLIAYAFSGAGPLTLGFCQRLFPIISVFGVAFNGFGDFIALLHLATLWRHDRRALYILILVFTATTIVAVTCLCVVIAKATKGIIYDQHLEVCVFFLHRPSIVVVAWVAGALFDLTALIFLTVKSSMNYKTMLCHSGTLYFVVSFSIRIFNLVDSVALPDFFFPLMATVSWPCLVINLSRFVFRLRSRQRLRDLESLSLQTLSASGHPILPYQNQSPKHLHSIKMDANMSQHDHHGDYDSIIEMNAPATLPPLDNIGSIYRK